VSNHILGNFAKLNNSDVSDTQPPLCILTFSAVLAQETYERVGPDFDRADHVQRLSDQSSQQGAPYKDFRPHDRQALSIHQVLSVVTAAGSEGVDTGKEAKQGISKVSLNP